MKDDHPDENNAHPAPRVMVENAAHIPKTATKHGLVLPYELTDNLVLCTYYWQPYSRVLSAMKKLS